MGNIRFGAMGMQFTPVEMNQQVARFHEAAGFDFLVLWDQLCTTIPRSIWTPDIVPAAASFDGDAMLEPFVLAAAAALATNTIAIGTTCDALRRPPAILAQLALSLGHLSKNRYFMCVGAGEVKQFSPYGLRRDRPFAHLGEAMRLIRLLWENDEPINDDGPIWPLQNALLAIHPFEDTPPPLYGMGSSHKTLEFIGRSGDGWMSTPTFERSPERFAEDVGLLKQHAEKAGRDPEALRINLGFAAIIGDDSEIDAVIENPALRWDAAAMVPDGELWSDFGLQNPLGKDFSYPRDLVPMDYDREQALRIAAQVPPEVVRALKYCGDEADLVAQIQPWIDAGANEILIVDYAAFVMAPDVPSALLAAGKVLNVCNTLRTSNGQAPGPTMDEVMLRAVEIIG